MTVVAYFCCCSPSGFKRWQALAPYSQLPMQLLFVGGVLSYMYPLTAKRTQRNMHKFIIIILNASWHYYYSFIHSWALWLKKIASSKLTCFLLILSQHINVIFYCCNLNVKDFYFISPLRSFHFHRCLAFKYLPKVAMFSRNSCCKVLRTGLSLLSLF